MKPRIKMTGRLICAARGLAGVSQEDFARAAGLTTDAIAQMETAGSALVDDESDALAVYQACDKLGVVVIGEDGQMGAGVRLKFTRQDVKQIVRLEGEGGIARLDDAP